MVKEDILCSLNARTQLHFHTQLPQDNLQTGDRGDGIKEIVIAEMSDAEDPSLHFALSVGDDRPELILEGFDNFA